MTMSNALARIFEIYTEGELLDAKDEPDTDIAAHVDAIAKEFAIYGKRSRQPMTARRRAKLSSGHTSSRS